uniref:CUB domain-containing protein n=1 Tax=Parastrongyloides trichosuri TaxID=131310 RepID=A0A0N4Z441_PARTI
MPCRVGGYPNPKNCNVCKCPRFYTGTYCQSILKSSPGCGNARLTAVSTPKMLTLGGIKSCYVELVVPQGSKIRMTITEANLARSFVCEPNNGLEVKYLNDKAVSGIMYCGTIRNKNVVSESNNIVMRFVGKSGYHNVKIRYQKV